MVEEKKAQISEASQFFMQSHSKENGKYVMICEQASSAFIFASTSNDQFSHASSEDFRNNKWRAASTSLIFRQLESLFIKNLS